MDFKDRKPFEPEKLEEERALEKSWPISVRINEQEKAMIDKLRDLLDIEGDSKALKKGAEIGLNVLLGVFGEKMIKYLCEGNRERKSDYEGRGKSKKTLM
jgi:hypothetical protein